MDLKQFRKQYPAYNDWSDQELATGLHKQYYSDMPFESFAGQVGYTPPAKEDAPVAEPAFPVERPQTETKTSNVFKGIAAGTAKMLGEGVEGFTRATEALGKKMEGSLTEEQRAGMQELKEKSSLPTIDFDPNTYKKLQGTATNLKNWGADIGYSPSTQMKEIPGNPLKLIPFIAERVITSIPDMAAAVAVPLPYIVSRTNAILNERIKNDGKKLEDVTVSDVAIAASAATAETYLEKAATKGLFKPTTAKTGAGRIGKETAIQSSTEGIESGIGYLGGTAGTKKGVDYGELGEQMLEGAIVGGGLGAGVQGTKEAFRPKTPPTDTTTEEPKFEIDPQTGVLRPIQIEATTETTQAAPLTKQGELFTKEEAPYQVTPGDVNVEAQARQEQSDRAQEQIAVLNQQLAQTTDPQQAATIRDDISKLEPLVQETGQQKATSLGNEFVTLYRKGTALGQQRAELEQARDAEKTLDGKAAITEQIKAIEGQIDQIVARQEEISAEGKKLEKEGVTFDKTKDDLDLKGPSPIVNKKVLAKFGLAPKAPIRQELLNLDMTDPEDRQKFIDAVDKHTIKKAKIDMAAIEEYLNVFEQKQESPFERTRTEPSSRVETGTSQPGLPMLSGRPGDTQGTAAPQTQGLDSAVPAIGGPLARTGALPSNGAGALTPTAGIAAPPGQGALGLQTPSTTQDLSVEYTQVTAEPTMVNTPNPALANMTDPASEWDKVAEGNILPAYSNLPEAAKAEWAASNRDVIAAQNIFEKYIKQIDAISDAQKLLQNSDIHNELSTNEKKVIAEHYGEESYNDVVKSKFVQDVITALTQGLDKVAAVLRNIIKRLQAGALAAVIAINTSAMSPPIHFAIPAMDTKVEAVVAQVPVQAASNMSEGAKRAYGVLYPAMKQYLQENNKLFIMTDKPSARMFIFNPDGSLLLERKILLGRAFGDYYKGNTDIRANRITPAGLFTMSIRQNNATAADYDFQTVLGLEQIEDGSKYFVTTMHSVWMHERDNQQRMAALQSQGTDDARMSFGCVNIDKPTFAYLYENHLDQINGAKTFIVPDNPADTMSFINGEAVKSKDMVRDNADIVTKTVKTPKSEVKAPESSKPVGTRREDFVTAAPVSGRESGVSAGVEQDVTAKMEGELKGKSTPELVQLINNGNLKAALQEIATSDQYTLLDKLMAERLLQSKTLPKVEIVSLKVTDGYPAQYDPNIDAVQITAGNIDSHTVLHETVHGFLHAMIRQSEAREAKGLGSNPRLNSLKDVYNHVKNKRPDLAKKYGMKDLSEFASEAMSNPDFQNDLRNTPYRRSNVFTEFGRSVLRAMGITPDKSGIADIDALAGAFIAVENILSTGRKAQEDVQGGVRQQVDLDVVRALGNDYEFSSPDTVGMTDKRIKDLFNDSAYTMDDAKAKGFIGYVSPQRFLDATRTYDEADRQESKENKPLDAKALAEESQHIFLTVEKAGTLKDAFRITGHEGRHRMMALRDAGVTQVPVYFRFYQGEKRSIEKFIYMVPQRFGSESAIQGFMVNELIPINYDNSKLIKEKFGVKEGQIAYMEPGAFKKWFGDSKVVNEDGSPMVVYHGTTADIKQFKMSKEGSLGAGIYMTPKTAFANNYAGMPTPAELAALEAEGIMAPELIAQIKAVQTTGNLVEGQIGGNVLPVYASIENPLIIRTVDRRFDPAVDLLVALGVSQAKAEAIVEKANEDKGGITKEVMARAQKQGYDGIMQYKDGVLSEVVAFSPIQVKSAIGNSGEYSRLSADIAKMGKRLDTVEGVIADGVDRITAAMRKHSMRSYDPMGSLSATQYNAVVKIEDGIEARLKKLGVEKPRDTMFNKVWPQARSTIAAEERGFDIPKVQRTPEAEKAEKDSEGFKTSAGPVPKAGFFKRTLTKMQAIREGNLNAGSMFGNLQNFAANNQAFLNLMRKETLELEKKGSITHAQAEATMLGLIGAQITQRAQLAVQMMDRGNWKYDPITNTYDPTADKDNMAVFGDLANALAKRLGVNPEVALGYIDDALEANRLQSVDDKLIKAKTELTRTEKRIEFLENDVKRQKTPAGTRTAVEQRAFDRTENARVEVVRKELSLKKELAKELTERIELYTDQMMHKDRANITSGMRLYNNHPEIKEATRVFNVMRQRTIDLMVETGLLTEEKAQTWLDEAAYVPFFRDLESATEEAQQVVTKGLRETMAPLRAKYKGSMEDVASVTSNMRQWMQWALAGSISNRQIKRMLDQYKAYLPDEVREGRDPDKGNFTVMENGVERVYNVDSPEIVQAFIQQGAYVIPLMDIAKSASDIARKNITRIPLFSVGQIPADLYAAMFTSGIRNPGALVVRLLGEAVKTTVGMSQTRKDLVRRGLLSTHEYNAQLDEDSIKYAQDIVPPSAYRRVMHLLDRFGAVSENIIRQAVYNQLRSEGASQQKAETAVVEIINFRNKSGIKVINSLSSSVIFFNSYLQSAALILKTLSGKGITYQTRAQGLAALGIVSAKIATFSFLLAALSDMADEEDEYAKRSRAAKNRIFNIPGTDGMGLAVREDLYVLPHILAQYAYRNMFREIEDRGVDMKSFKGSLKNIALNTLVPPSEGVPQLFKPTIEGALGVDIHTGRDIVPEHMKALEPELQFNATTAEYAKAMGAATGTSPLMIEHFVKGYFGTTAQLFDMLFGGLIADARNIPRPARSTNEVLAKLPSVGASFSKEENMAVAEDLYEAKKDFDRALKTYKKLNESDSKAAEEYRKENKDLMLNPAGTVKELENIKRRENYVRNLPSKEKNPEKGMTSEEKADELAILKERKDRLAPFVQRLREKANF
jgi:hypothetical protein